MKGWKTWAGALGLCAVGVLLIKNGQPDLGVACISGGLTAIGLGHKIEKAAQK